MKVRNFKKKNGNILERENEGQIVFSKDVMP
jgi:hypothetical protein